MSKIACQDPTSPLSDSSNDSSKSYPLSDDHMGKITVLLDRFTNDDECDLPIFEASTISLSLKDSSSHHISRSQHKKGWQGSCKSFVGLDCSDHSTNSFFNLREKSDRPIPGRRSLDSIRKSLLDCSIKMPSSSIPFEDEEDEEATKHDLDETNCTHPNKQTTMGLDHIATTKNSNVTIAIAQDATEIFKTFPKIKKNVSDLMSNSLHESKQSKHSNFELKTSTNRLEPPIRRKTPNYDEFQKILPKVHKLQRKEGYIICRPENKVLQQSKTSLVTRSLHESMKGLNLFDDTMESCSSISLCSFNDEDSTMSSGDEEIHLLSISHSFSISTQGQAGYRTSNKNNLAEQGLMPRIEDAIPKAPTRSHSPCRRIWT